MLKKEDIIKNLPKEAAKRNLVKLDKKELKENSVEEIWEAFKHMNEEDASIFYRIFGYGLNEIKDIGYEKYIAAMGWKNVDQVLSWKTDALHIMICPSCQKEFGIFEENAGLCKDCKDFFYNDLPSDLTSFPSKAGDDDTTISGIGFFIISKNVRNLFKANKGVVKDFKESEFLRLILTQRVYNDAAPYFLQQKVRLSEIPKDLFMKFVDEYRYKRKSMKELGVRDLAEFYFNKQLNPFKQTSDLLSTYSVLAKDVLEKVKEVI